MTMNDSLNLNLTKDICKVWMTNPNINPLTSRKILKSGRIFQNFKKACERHSLYFEEGEEILSQQSNQQRHEKKKKTEVAKPNFAWNEENNEIFKNSSTHIKNILPHFKNGTQSERKLVPHLDNVLTSKESPIPFHRTLDEINISQDIPYSVQSSSDRIRELSYFNCHDGQRKLTLGYLEFISNSIIDLKCKPDDIFIIYAGSSGLASSIALSLFPDLMMAIYDPDPNTVGFLPKVIRDKTAIYKNRADVAEKQIKWSPLMIFTDKAGWFTDAIATYCKNVLFPLSGRKHLLFVSDVRAETGELDIVKDMQSQMRWTIMLKCDYYMHKFRLPYFDVTNQVKIKNMYEDIRHLYPFLKSKPPIINSAQKDNASSVLYLDGTMFVQPFGPQRTTEFRLIGKPDAKKMYSLKYYNVTKIDNQSALFNNIYRGFASFKYGPKSSEYVSSYEKIAEYHILMNCVNTGYSVVEMEMEKEIKIRDMYNILNTIMLEIVKIKPNMDACKYVSMMKAIRKGKKKYNEIVPSYYDQIFKLVL